MRGFVCVTVVLGLAGCSWPPPAIQAGPDPSDPAAPIQAVASPLPPGATTAPVAPLPWRDVNRRVGPGQEPGR